MQTARFLFTTVPTTSSVSNLYSDIRKPYLIQSYKTLKICYLLASYFVTGLKTRSGDVDDGAAQHITTLRRENQRQICASYTRQKV